VAVTGLAFEARIVAGPSITVVCSGDRRQLKRSIELAVRRRCQGIISFGIAGGLAPHLKPGACIIARNVIFENVRYVSHRGWAQSLMEMIGSACKRGSPPGSILFADIAGSDLPLASVQAKQWLHESTGTLAVDMESHVAARIAADYQVPFVALRVITDPSHRALPPAALVATRPDGTIAVGTVLRSLISNPAQLPTLFRIGLDSWAARQTLTSSRRLLGTNLGMPICHNIFSMGREKPYWGGASAPVFSPP
jgi:adenosylhomocysteine nucleosidase